MDSRLPIFGHAFERLEITGKDQYLAHVTMAIKAAETIQPVSKTMKRFFPFAIIVLSLLFFFNHASAAPSDHLADELAIQRVVTEIDVAVDQKDWTRARTFFTNQVQVDFSSLTGLAPAMISAEDLIGGWTANLGPNKQSYHQRGFGLVTLDGDRATFYSNGYAWNRMEGNGDPLWEVWGNYTYELVRRSEGWKVASMTFAMTHERGNMWVKTTPSEGG